ncbi:hypothetical protein F0227_20310 [Vibrio sp. 99-8-1]|nr:hypothetical protein [Vibrio sp. 99-8-1]
MSKTIEHKKGTIDKAVLFPVYHHCALGSYLYIGMSRFGNIALRTDDKKPEYFNLIWLGMILTLGSDDIRNKYRVNSRCLAFNRERCR